MAITVDYSTAAPWLITIPKSDLTLITGTQYQLTVDAFWLLLADFTDNENTMARPTLYSRIPATSSTPSITTINDTYYTLEFEDGLYSVNIINGNTNIREVEVKNQVSVNTNNTTGFIDPTFLESGLFNEGVILDTVNGVAGTGKTPSGGIIGTRQTPSDNLADAKLIAEIRGQRSIVVKQSMEFETEDLSSGYSIIGDSPFTVLTLNSTVDVTNCSFHDLTIVGDMDGANNVDRCFVNAVTNVSGIFDKCSFSSTVTLNGDTDIYDCYSRVAGAGYPTISAGAHQVIIRGYRGSIGLEDAVAGHLSSIGVNEGRLTVESSCVGGEVHMRGIPFDLADNSGASCTVLDETEGVKVAQIPFDNGVAIDTVNGFAGTGLAPNGNQIGTRLAPSNNLVDTLTIADREGFRKIYVLNNIIGITEDCSNGYTFIGDTLLTIITFSNGSNSGSCSFENLFIAGFLSTDNNIKNSAVSNVNDISGLIEGSEVFGVWELAGFTTFNDCFAKQGFEIDLSAGQQTSIVRFSGSLTIDNCVAQSNGIDMAGGVLTIGPGCTGGTIAITGTPFEIIDNSNGTTVIDSTESTKTNNIHNAHFRRRVHDTVLNTITLYEEDGVTPWRVFDANDELTDIDPQ